MADDLLEQARDQIEQADLPSTVYRTARRLLDRAESQAGQLRLTEAEFQAICQTKAEGTLRSHLGQLAGAGIIRYSRREGSITILFEAWANVQLALAAEVIAERSDRALSDHLEGDGEGKSDRSAITSRAERSKRALSDQNEGATSHARSGRWVGINTTNPSKKRPTYPPKPSQSPPLGEMQQLALGLLVDSDVGVLHEIARELAEKLPAADIFRAVDKWLPDAQAGRVTAGALVTRLRELEPSGAPSVTLSATFLNSDLYSRHPLPDEVVRDPTRNHPSDYQPPDFVQEANRAWLNERMRQADP